jgi:hypothetical protein
MSDDTRIEPMEATEVAALRKGCAPACVTAR